MQRFKSVRQAQRIIYRWRELKISKNVSKCWRGVLDYPVGTVSMWAFLLFAFGVAYLIEGWNGIIILTVIISSYFLLVSLFRYLINLYCRIRSGLFSFEFIAENTLQFMWTEVRLIAEYIAPLSILSFIHYHYKPFGIGAFATIVLIYSLLFPYFRTLNGKYVDFIYYVLLLSSIALFIDQNEAQKEKYLWYAETTKLKIEIELELDAAINAIDRSDLKKDSATGDIDAIFCDFNAANSGFFGDSSYTLSDIFGYNSLISVFNLSNKHQYVTKDTDLKTHDFCKVAASIFEITDISVLLDAMPSSSIISDEQHTTVKRYFERKGKSDRQKQLETISQNPPAWASAGNDKVSTRSWLRMFAWHYILCIALALKLARNKVI